MRAPELTTHAFFSHAKCGPLLTLAALESGRLHIPAADGGWLEQLEHVPGLTELPIGADWGMGPSAFVNQLQDVAVIKELKVATLLFDVVTLGLPEGAPRPLFEVLARAEGLSPATRTEMEQLFAEPPMHGDSEPSEFGSSIAQLVSAIAERATETLEDRDATLSLDDLKEIAAIKAQATATFSSWLGLARERPVALVARDFERSAIDGGVRGWGAAQSIKTVQRFSERRAQVPTNLRWTDVLRLRRHKNIRQFRAKVNEVIGLANELGNFDDAAGLLEDCFDVALRTMAESLDGSVFATAIKATLGTALVPVSIALGLNDIRRVVEASETFGWSYFALSLENLP